MKNPLKKIVYWSGVLVACILGLYGRILLIVHLPPVQKILLSFVEKKVDPLITGTVSIGTSRTTLISSITFMDIQVKNREPEPGYANIGKVHISYRLPALLHRRIALEMIRIRNGEIVAIRGK